MESRNNRRKNQNQLTSILKKLKRTIYSEGFLESSRSLPIHFTRKRKLNFPELILFQLNAGKRSLQNELDDYLNLLKKKTSYTKQAYSESRQKILPETFKELNEILILNYYKSNEYRRHKKYRILAIDGSTLRLPNTLKLKEEFGIITSQSTKTLAASGISVLYDVENHLIIDSTIESYFSSERKMAIKHMEKLKDFKSKSKDINKELIIFDRGYPSLDLIMNLLEKNINFLMRVSNRFLKEVNEFRKTIKQEEILEIAISKQRLRTIKTVKIKENIRNIKIRALKIKLDSGEEEILITSLMDDKDFSYKEFKELYFKRWGIEENYDILKNIIEVEDFTGITPIAIKQDFYGSVIIKNIIELFQKIAQTKVDKDNNNKNRKYKYQVNQNLSFGKYKNNIIFILYMNKKMKEKIEILIYEIAKNITPIREGRSFLREVKYGNKYSMNKKRA